MTSTEPNFVRFTESDWDCFLGANVFEHDGSDPFVAEVQVDGDEAFYIFAEDDDGILNVQVTNEEDICLRLNLPDTVLDVYNNPEDQVTLLQSMLPKVATTGQLALIGFNEF